MELPDIPEILRQDYVPPPEKAPFYVQIGGIVVVAVASIGIFEALKARQADKEAPHSITIVPLDADETVPFVQVEESHEAPAEKRVDDVPPVVTENTKPIQPHNEPAAAYIPPLQSAATEGQTFYDLDAPEDARRKVRDAIRDAMNKAETAKHEAYQAKRRAEREKHVAERQQYFKKQEDDFEAQSREFEAQRRELEAQLEGNKKKAAEIERNLLTPSR